MESKYLLALRDVPLIGDIGAKKLLRHFHSASAIFEASGKALVASQCLQHPQIQSLRNYKADEKKIEQELSYLDTHQIRLLSILDKDYPIRLQECNDAPSMLFFQGNCDLNATKTIAIIGTRNNTHYGLETAQKIIEDLATTNPLIISGLADGIDGIAHKKATEIGLATVGVLGHGLDTMYPTKHRTLAKTMIGNGGLLTEYPTKTIPDKQNFPMRNRIVAGMSDIILVIESSETGGAIITAKIGSSYDREICAIPGRITDKMSLGCNMLVRKNIAHAVSSADDILELMNWDKRKKKKAQSEMFLDLNAEEEVILKILEKETPLHFDTLLTETQWSYSSLSNILLSLELKNLVRALPGKKYDIH